MYFKNREQAGIVLGEELYHEWKDTNPVVIALPRGGVPVACAVAKRLGADLEVLMVRKLASPENPEYAIGAVAEDDSFFVNSESFANLAVSVGELNEMILQADKAMDRQRLLYRRGRAPMDLKGRNVMVVDDGLATGATMMAAVSSVRDRGAHQVAVAVPVASKEAIQQLEGHADRVYASFQPETFHAVGEWYEDFAPVSDEEVIRRLIEARRIARGHAHRKSYIEVA